MDEIIYIYVTFQTLAQFRLQIQGEGKVTYKTELVKDGHRDSHNNFAYCDMHAVGSVACIDSRC
jgi:hypothetical protein